MEYQPLALKYRPQRFADVVGQEVVTTTLRNAIEAGRISHAYLFSGMRGVGKTSVARILAKCLNCLSFDEPTTEPCDGCESCREVMASRSIDVLEIDGASNTSVDDVRALQENLIYAPARDRYKIYIVDEVHMLSKSAFNAFLKTLEEPPPRVVFIFATTEMHKIPATVLSRCLLFDFGRVSSAAIADRLRAICAAEKIEAEDAAVDLIVFQSEGSIRDAISALDQIVNFAGNKIGYDDALKALGLIDRDVLRRFVDAVVDQDAEGAFAVVHDVAGAGADMRLFCRQLIRHVRDLLVARIGGSGPGVLPYSDAERELLREQSQRLSEEDLSRFFDILARADGEMQHSAVPQYHLEAAAVKMIHSTRLTPLTELIARLESGAYGAPARPAVTPMEQRLEFDAPAHARPRAGSAESASDRERLLGALRGTILNRLLGTASEIRREDDKLLIVCNEVTRKSVGGNENLEKLKKAVRDVFGEEVRVEFAAPGARAAGETPPDDEPRPTTEEPEPDAAPEGASAPLAVERKVKDDPLAGRLFQSLDMTLDRAREATPPADEEDKEARKDKEYQEDEES